jgi:hypothetical protein
MEMGNDDGDDDANDDNNYGLVLAVCGDFRTFFSQFASEIFSLALNYNFFASSYFIFFTVWNFWLEFNLMIKFFREF